MKIQDTTEKWLFKKHIHKIVINSLRGKSEKK